MEVGRKDVPGFCSKFLYSPPFTVQFLFILNISTQTGALLLFVTANQYNKEDDEENRNTPGLNKT